MILTAKQAADFLHVHAETVKEWAAAGKIPGSKKTGRWLFVEADLVEYVRSGYPERWRVPQHTPGEYKCEENTGVSKTPDERFIAAIEKLEISED